MSHLSFSSLFALGLILVVSYFAGRLQGIDPGAAAQLSDGVIGVGGALLTGVLGASCSAFFSIRPNGPTAT